MDLGFDVVDLPAADPPREGEQAPDFTRPLVTDEFWEDRSLADVAAADGPLLLVFHPMDGAFPSTYIYNEVRDREWTDDLSVVGCSISDPYAHAQLIAERGVDVRLFSDPDATVAERFGIAHDLDGMTGITEPRPAVFVLEPDLTVAYSWVAQEWPDFPDYDAVAAAIAEVA